MTTGIGQTLREAREQRGLSLDDAAEDTRIRATNLAAIEQEDFDRLGGEVYVRGFIRSYAKCLQLDPEALLQQYRPAAAEPAPAADAPASVPQPLERTPRRGLGAIVAVLALAAIAGLAVLSEDATNEPSGLSQDPAADGGGSQADDEPGDQPDPGAGGATPATPAPPAPTPTPSAQRTTPAAGVRVVLETGERDVWLRALVDGDQVMTETLPPGSTETFQGQQQIRLRLGDAGAVELTVNGQPQGSLGGSGEPVWITIDADGDVTTG